MMNYNNLGQRSLA